MKDPISDLPQQQECELLTIDGDYVVEEAHMFERGLCFYEFYCFCILH